jgi:superfamily II DNA or RNA helicase
MQWRPKKSESSAPRARRSVPVVQTREKPSVREPERAKEKRQRPPKLSRLHKPDGMSLEDWQIELRRQFGREQNYKLENVGEHPFFSIFNVVNPQSQSNYRVHIRGVQPGDNYCSCPDFATNTLGTCKHIEFTLAVLERKRGGVAALRSGYQPYYSEVYLHYGARREVRFRPGSDCPLALARLAARYFDADGALLPDAFGRFESFVAEAAKLDHEVRCHDDVLGFIAEVRDAERRRTRVAEAFPKGANSTAFKNLLKVSLYDYQREGVLFAARAGRCLLGDEMGLGKTVQAIATAEIMARLFGVERVLIVCPTSLKHQWEREIQRCATRTVEVINGLRDRRELHFAADSFFKITNYDTIYRDLDLIESWSPDFVVLDEAQRIKNWDTRTARSVKKIAAPYALVLTGTPLENRLEELISIVQFVDRFRLGPTFRLLHEHQIRDGDGKVIGYQHLDRIGKTLEPILVRRHKDEVLDQLPERIDSNIFVPMTDLQRKHHSENLEIVARIVHKWRRYRYLSEADQRRLMIALMRMRMSCDNSYLVDHRSDRGPKADEAAMLLDEILETPNVKAVVFSQWLRMHELLIRRFEDRKWDHVLFHGGLSSNKRKETIDRFRDDPTCRVFLSTDSGGVGLNLQHASVVLNMDLPWNPAVLEQRIGRVHRLGQRQPVRVINFVAQGTIEEGMLAVLKFKKSLFAGVLDSGEKEVFLGGSRLNKFMETVESATTAIPEAMIEDAEEALRLPPDERAGPEPRESRRGRRRPQPTPLGISAEPEEEAAPALVSAAASDPWTSLFQSGLALLQQLAVPSAAASTPSGNGPAPRSLVQRDERTGETYLKLPVPPPEVLNQAVQAFGALLQSLRK